MTAIDATNDLHTGQTVEGFLIDKITPLPELRATAIQATHLKSGARILHVLAPQDTENLFSVTFPTPPPDDAGLPHILEHAVLGGSKKFPVREPFFEMVKMSMATFINAMTARMYTMYPVSSNVRKDFYNLVEVYLDAVFHPELTQDTFRREGHHLTLENNADLNSALKVSGIVYNEMKGAYSSPESLVYREMMSGLFPDTPGGRDSGGDPDVIPDLTYEQFKRFHENLYHPSNGLFFIYGDIPTVDHFRFIAPVLNGFEKRSVTLQTPRQPRWTSPRIVEKTYPIGASEDLKSKTFFTLNWIVADATDPDLSLDWEVLERLLLGTESAPLKKAIIDSKLGADLFFAGSSASTYELTFHVGLKGSEPDRIDAFEKLVLDTLARVADEAFPSERVEATFQQLAYDTLEVNSHFPLHVMRSANHAWPYGSDPLKFLAGKKNLDACHARYLADPGRFNRMIREALLANPHRLRIAVRPDCEQQARADAAFARKMADKRATLNPDQISEIARTAAALVAAQGVPNSPEALAKLPQLKSSDLPRKPRHIPTQVAQFGGVTVLRNDVFSNGVNYLEIDMDLAGLPVELYPWISRYLESVNTMGAAGQNFGTISERRAACTGGLWAYASNWLHNSDPSRPTRQIRFTLKTLDGQMENAMGLLGDLVFNTDPRDKDRLRDVLVQTRASWRTSLINDGQGTARRHAFRGLSPVGALDYLFMSPKTLRVIDDLTEHFDQHAESIMSHIEQIRDFIAGHTSWTASFTGSDRAFATLARTFEQWNARRNLRILPDVLPEYQPFTSSMREGLAGPMKIAHCVKAMPGPHLAHPDVPLFRLGVYLASFDLLLPEIRFKGNAYGAGAYHDDSGATFSLTSFRDPNIVETLATFNRVHDYIADQKWSQTDIDRAIIGSAKSAEAPIRPGSATGMALIRHLRGDTDSLREARYAATLAATPSSVKETFLRVLDINEPKSAICVVSSREKLDQANERLGEKALSVSNILP